MCPEQEEEETDELLLLDEEMLDAPPEDLPRRLLTNFAVYNAEVGAKTAWHEHSTTPPGNTFLMQNRPCVWLCQALQNPSWFHQCHALFAGFAGRLI